MPSPAPLPAERPPAAAGGAATLPIVLAAAAVLGWLAALRLGVAPAWSYDDFFHLALARELLAEFPLRTFPWTPLSVLADPFVDKEPLFHLVLMPLVRLPLATAAWVGAQLGQLFLVGAVAWLLRRERVPHAWLWVLWLAAAGPIVVLRLEAVRPHVWLLGMSAVVLGLLFSGARPLAIAVACALFGQLHVGGWLGVLFAVVWVLARRWGPGGAAPLRPQPALAAAAGWLAGQLVHPNLPHNFWLLWKVNVGVPLAATGGSSRALREAIGVELLPLPPAQLLEQWPLFVCPLVALAMLARHRTARTPATVTLAALLVPFLVGGTFFLRRLLENGAVLGVLTLALVLAARQRAEGRPPLSRRGVLAMTVLVVAGVAWTTWLVRDFGRGQERPHGRGQPIAMAEFLGARGRPGALVFTAQWADSAPLFYAAPQLRSLVALDPTFLHAADPQRFERYWALAGGRSGNLVGEIQRRFGATYVTVWKAPAFIPLTRQLRRDRRVVQIYDDPYYEVWELLPR